MRSFTSGVLSVSYLLPLFVWQSRAALSRIDDGDPWVQWSPQTVLTMEECKGKPGNTQCTGSWWTESVQNASSGSYHTTWGPNTSFSFSFTGSSFMIFGPTFWAGAAGIVTIDGTRVGTFTTLADGVIEPLPQQLVYMHGDLDPLQPHQVQISYDPTNFSENSRKWLGIDFVVVDETRAPTVSSTTTTPQPTATLPAPSPSSGAHGANLGLIVATSLLSGMCILLATALFLVMRRRQPSHSPTTIASAYFVSPEQHKGPASPQPFSPSPPYHNPMTTAGGTQPLFLPTSSYAPSQPSATNSSPGGVSPVPLTPSHGSSHPAAGSRSEKVAALERAREKAERR